MIHMRQLQLIKTMLVVPMEERSEIHKVMSVIEGWAVENQKSCIVGRLPHSRTPEDLPSRHPIMIAKAVAPILKLLKPGDLAAFEKAIERLGKHKRNMLLQYVIAMTKYPVFVEVMSKHFSTLRKKITDVKFQEVCHRIILEASDCNENTIHVIKYDQIKLEIF